MVSTESAIPREDAEIGSGDSVARAKQAAAKLADSALGAVCGTLESAKQVVADGVKNAADALQGTARDLPSGATVPAADILTRGSEKLEAGSAYLARSSVADLLFDLGDFTRDRPVLVLGGAFLVGLLAARFLKAAPPEHL